ncbi:MAG: hypothetical protein U0529_09595 [Thermoanaerobaculia bacterium]
MPRPNGKRLPGDPLRHIPLVERRKLVAHAFSGVIEAIELEEDLTVYRHWGGKSAKTPAPWLSPKKYPSAAAARRGLALPDGNTADNVDSFVIPKGTIILLGRAASQVGQDGFGSYATGGDEQIYLPDPTAARSASGGTKS